VHIKAKNWSDVSSYIKLGSSSPVPMSTIASMCFKEGNKDLAMEAVMQMPETKDETIVTGI